MTEKAPLCWPDIGSSQDPQHFVVAENQNQTNIWEAGMAMAVLPAEREEYIYDDVFDQFPNQLLKRMLKEHRSPVYLPLNPLNPPHQQPDPMVLKLRSRLIRQDIEPLVNYFKLSRETLHLAVNIFDRFTALADVSPSDGTLLALGIASTSIASKKEDTNPPTISEMLFYTFQKPWDTVESIHVANLEFVVLKKLEWTLEVFTTPTIMACILQIYINQHPNIAEAASRPNFIAKMERYYCLADKTLTSYHFMQYSPIARALACLNRSVSAFFSWPRYYFLRWAYILVNQEVSVAELCSAATALEAFVESLGFPNNLPSNEPSLYPFTEQSVFMGSSPWNVVGARNVDDTVLYAYPSSPPQFSTLPTQSGLLNNNELMRNANTLQPRIDNNSFFSAYVPATISESLLPCIYVPPPHPDQSSATYQPWLC